MLLARIIASLILVSTSAAYSTRLRSIPHQQIWITEIPHDETVHPEELTELAQQPVSNRCLTPTFFCYLPGYAPIGEQIREMEIASAKLDFRLRDVSGVRYRQLPREAGLVETINRDSGG